MTSHDDGEPSHCNTNRRNCGYKASTKWRVQRRVSAYSTCQISRFQTTQSLWYYNIKWVFVLPKTKVIARESIATSELFQNMSLLIVPNCLPCHKNPCKSQYLEIKVQKNQQSSWVITDFNFLLQ